MKIIHIFPYSSRCPGGHSNAIREFIACQQAAGLDAVGLSPSTEELFQNDLGLAAGISEIEFADPAAVSAEINRLGNGRSVIVHLHAIDPLNTVLAARARQDGHAVALTSHGQLNVRSPLHALKKFLYLAMCRSPLRYANGIHVLTNKERQRLGILIPRYKGIVVSLPHIIHPPPAVAPTESIPDLEECKRKRPFTVLHLGRLDVFTKGLDLLVEGFANSGLDEAQLVLAGPDWKDGRAKLETLAHNLGCSQRVVFPGPVYGVEKEKLLASADLFVASSRWDAFNISLAEALLRGIPAVVSSRLNIANNLAEENAAFVVSCSAKAIADALRHACADSRRSSSVALKGQQWVRLNCNADTVGQGFSAFYREILSIALDHSLYTKR